MRDVTLITDVRDAANAGVNNRNTALRYLRAHGFEWQSAG